MAHGCQSRHIESSATAARAHATEPRGCFDAAANGLLNGIQTKKRTACLAWIDHAHQVTLVIEKAGQRMAVAAGRFHAAMNECQSLEPDRVAPAIGAGP